MIALLMALALSGTGLQGGGLAGGPVATPTMNGGTYVTATGADYQLYVDSTGSDANVCTSPGTSACKTIQAAINKIPKLLRHRAIVSVAAGNFAGAVVSGFGTDIGIQRATAGILIDGTMATSTGLASGTASGTASAGSAGTTNTFGTLTDATQAWTIDNLQGKFITVTAGTGVGDFRPICNNSATVITICGTWTAPAAGSVYAIQDSSTFITSCVSNPPSATGTATATLTSAFRTQSNANSATITFRGISFSGACSFGLYSNDDAVIIANRLQFVSGGATVAKILANGPVYIDSIATAFAGTSGIHIATGALAAVNASVAGGIGNISGPLVSRGTIQNSLFVNGATGVNISNFAAATILGLQFVNINTRAVQLGGSVSNLQGLIIDCTGAAGAVAVYVGDLAANASGGISPDHITITDCEIAFRVSGSMAWIQSANALTVSTVTTGYDVRNGGLASFTASGAFSVGGNEISLDNAGVTATFASIPASANCVTSLNYGSRVCRD